MNQDNDAGEMRPEYDIRGGVRGKYFGAYWLQRGITFEGSPYVAKSTATAPQIGSVTRSLIFPPLLPSPTLQIPDPAGSTVYAGSNPPR